MKEETKIDFLQSHKNIIDTLGFWREEYKATVMVAIERCYKTEVIRDYFIADIVINGDNVLTKWKRRFEPLTDVQLKEDYNR